MPAEIDFKITGLDEALESLKRFPEEMQRKGIRFAMRKAANLVRDAAVSNAEKIDDPETSESIAKNINVRFSTRTFKRTGDVAFRVGVMGGSRQYGNTKENARKGRAGKSYATGGDKGNPGGDTWYWRLVEFGTKNAPANPFLRPALSQNTDAAISMAASEMNKWIDRNLKKIAKQPK